MSTKDKAKEICPICRRDKVLVNDHCHVEGEQRERICATCNSGLGMFKDDPEVMRRAADYLEQWKATFEDDELLAHARSLAHQQYRKLFPRV